MARHSKWHNIKHRKASSDVKKGKTFTKHAKLITLAVKQGGADSEMNPLLRAAIDEAKADNVPNDNIERAIKKGSGEMKDDVIIEEIYYDAFGPGGTALLIQVLTDNRNRALTNVKIIINKRGGRFADSGSVAWMFKKLGLCIVDISAKDAEEVELMAIDAGAIDIRVEEKEMLVWSPPEKLMSMRKELVAGGLSVLSAQMVFESETKVKLDPESQESADLDLLLEYLEEDEDVSNVYTNVEYS